MAVGESVDAGTAADEARRVVAANAYMRLATADADGRPWATPVWFAALDCADELDHGAVRRREGRLGVHRLGQLLRRRVRDGAGTSIRVPSSSTTWWSSRSAASSAGQ